jgi:outer membrane protein OmpA-like peptidoglycan-associated protein
MHKEESAVKPFIVLAIAASAFVAGCASTPKQIDQLEQARAEVETLSQDPLAAQVANVELRSARDSLNRADAALKEGEPREEVLHLAYVAQRYAEIGKSRIEEAQARQQIAQSEAERNRVLLEARTREAEAAQEKAQVAEAAAEGTQQELQALQKELTDLQAQQTERGMVLTLGDVLFDTGAATLKPGADLVISRLSEFLSEYPDTRVIIEGHADSRGSEAYNQELSARRAQAVADALISRGVPSNRFEILGRGESFPVASNDSSAGRQQNRRVEIVFSDDKGRFAEGARRTTLQ